MKLWIRKLSGFVVAAMLMISLSDKACAAENEDASAAPSSVIAEEEPAALGESGTNPSPASTITDEAVTDTNGAAGSGEVAVEGGATIITDGNGTVTATDQTGPAAATDGDGAGANEAAGTAEIVAEGGAAIITDGNGTVTATGLTGPAAATDGEGAGANEAAGIAEIVAEGGAAIVTDGDGIATTADQTGFAAGSTAAGSSDSVLTTTGESGTGESGADENRKAPAENGSRSVGTSGVQLRSLSSEFEMAPPPDPDVENGSQTNPTENGNENGSVQQQNGESGTEDETPPQNQGTITVATTEYSGTTETLIDGTQNQGGEVYKWAVVDSLFSNSGWVTSGSWNYEAEDDCLYLDNYDSKSNSLSLSTEGRDLRIMAAGVNRVQSIICDGDLDIVGTGIFLVDDLALTEGHEVRLHANTALYGEDEGSVALFLKQEDGSYLLVNGSLPGLLNDGYELPDGVKLVVPESGSLKLRSIYKTQNDDGNGGTATQYALAPTGSGNWTEIEGVLKVESITMAENTSLSLQGVCELVLRGVQSVIDKLSIQGSATVNLGGSSRINTMDVTGDVTMQFSEDDVIGNLIVKNSNGSRGTMELLADTNLHADAPSLTLTGTVSANLRTAAGILCFGPDSDPRNCSVALEYDSGILGIRNGQGLAILNNSVYDLTIKNRLSSAQDPLQIAPLALKADQATSVREDYQQASSQSGSSTIPGQPYGGIDIGVRTYYFEIPVEHVMLYTEKFDKAYNTNSEYRAVNEEKGIFSEDLTADGKRYYVTVTDALLGASSTEVKYDDFSKYFGSCGSDPVVELLMKNSNGELYTQYLRKSGDKASNSMDLCSVRIIDLYVFIHSQGGGGTMTTTTLSYTGSGMLGGSGAGSLGTGVTLSSGSIRTYVPPPVDNNSSQTTTGDNSSSQTTTGDNNSSQTTTGDNNSSQTTGDNNSSQTSQTTGNNTGNNDTNSDNQTDIEKPDEVATDNPLVPESLQIVVEPADDEETSAAKKTPGAVEQQEVFENRSEVLHLRVFAGKEELKSLNGMTVQVSVEWQKPESWNPEFVFAVFRGEDGELHAFRASWDEKAKAFVFDSDQLGEFVLVYMEDWPEELLFKNDFYAALEEIMKQQLPVKGTEI